MFNIPKMYQMDMSFEMAEEIMSLHKNSGVTIIDRMENMLSEWISIATVVISLRMTMSSLSSSSMKPMRSMCYIGK
jgi:hypothetical protein